MASTVWKGYISFGLISVPIRLFVAARENHISFNQIHQVCGSRIKQQTYCPTCERLVERSELVKGYATDKENYIIVSSDELKALEAQSSETMEILQFVQLPDVDPLYYQTSYFTVAEDPGRKAYSLIHKGMQDLKLGAIAKITLHQREQIVMIRPFEKGLVLHTLYYPEEIRAVAEYDNQPEVATQKAEVELAEQFMKQLTAEFHPEKLKDEYTSRVEQLIESKQGQAAAPGKQERKKLAPVIDLMEALRRSMGQAAPASVASSAPPPPNPDDDEKKPPQRVTSKTAAKKKKAV